MKARFSIVESRALPYTGFEQFCSLPFPPACATPPLRTARGKYKRRNVFRRTGGAAVWRPAVKRRAQAAARSCIAEAAGLRFTIMAEVILKNVRKVYPNTESKKKKKKDEAVEKKNNLEITDEGVVAVHFL